MMKKTNNINSEIKGMEEDDKLGDLNLTKKDVETILETNENPPPPNNKLKEAFKKYLGKNKR